MHWPQLPDMSPKGIDVSLAGVILADDFKCTATGPIRDIHLWGSFYKDVLPENGPDSLTFELRIYSDIPADADRWSRPGELLWKRIFRVKLPGLAFAEIVLLWFAILATTVSFWRLSRTAGWLMLPYLAWVSLASALNLAIWRLNA